MTKFTPIVKDGKLGLAYDGNADGENSVTLDIELDEAISEVLKKGEAVEGETVVKFKIDPIEGLTLQIDADKDGEPSVNLKVDIMEAVQESGLLK